MKEVFKEIPFGIEHTLKVLKNAEDIMKGENIGEEEKEYDVFLNKVPYQTAVVDGVAVRYQYGGKDGAPVILFFNGLEMQEMWMPYAERLGKKYRFLIYEYPFHTTNADEQIDFAAKLLKAYGKDRRSGQGAECLLLPL